MLIGKCLHSASRCRQPCRSRRRRLRLGDRVNLLIETFYKVLTLAIHNYYTLPLLDLA